MNKTGMFRCVAGILMVAALTWSGKPAGVWASSGETGTADSGWERKEDGSWFHRSGTGQIDKGWFRDTDGGWYYLGTDGVMLAGRWYQDADGRWYYLNMDGRMLAGQWFRDSDGIWYYLGASGAMMNGCITPDGYTLLENGAWDASVPQQQTARGIVAGVSGQRHSGSGSSGGSSGGSGSGGGGGDSSGSSGSSGGGSGNGSRADGITATPSDAEEVTVPWNVFFVDRETRQYSLAPPRSGSVRDGESLVVNFRRRIVDNRNRIWETEAKSPVTFQVYGPGTWVHYIEYEQTGTLPEQENPYEEEGKRLAGWYQTAKEAEAEITGEDPERIPDSRFLAETGEENDVRLLTIADQVSASEEPLVYVIGKNLVPNGIILEKYFRDELEYSHMVEDTFWIGADVFYVSRFTMRWETAAENCHHIFEEERHSEPTCLRKGRAVYTCVRCGFEENVMTAALGHTVAEGESVCGRCKRSRDDIAGDKAEQVHWNIGDVQAREIDGETYLFRCIDQNYTDEMETHRQSALFLCDSVIPADFGSDYCRKETADGSYDYQFRPGPIVNFGSGSDYKYSAVRSWLGDFEGDFFNTEPVNIGISRAYKGSTGERMYSQFQESDLTGSYIGSQKLNGKLFILSVDEAIRYRDFLWKFDGSEQENPETQTGNFCKGYWLRTPEGDRKNHDTGRVYIVDLVNGNLRPCPVSPEGGTADEELNVTGTTGVRPVFTMPQD